MKFRIVFVFALLLTAAAAFGNPTDMFAGYEHARQGLIKASLPEVQAGARHLASAARAGKQAGVAAKADALAAARDLNAAKEAFSAVSDDMIAVRNAAKGERPVVAYCSMAKKSWLQPKGPISNPYYDASMRSCGEIKAR